MWRAIAGIVAGLAAWIVVVTVLNWGLRAGLPGYTQAEPAMSLTLGMRIARLSIAALTSLAAGALVHVIAPASRWAPWVTGGLLLALFVPEHIHVWRDFPVWYHLVFLSTLVPLVAFGAWLVRRKPAGPAS